MAKTKEGIETADRDEEERRRVFTLSKRKPEPEDEG
jgi:hypothetical protein